MTDVINYLAEAQELPLEESPSVLLPASYDIVWSLVVLVIVSILFKKFVLPKYREVLTEREDRIKGGIQRAEAAQAEAKAALEKYNAQLAEARAEAAEIREDARAKGKQIEADMKAKATEESNRIIESGEKQLAAQREQVVEELRREMGQNSISLAERLLGDQLSDDVKRSGTIDKFLAELDTVSPAGK
ncbi:F0F1 ATP synthase subunit B [Corynebacterium pseudotuberculosis]|uniref:ATP synthase subunit b n=1 Tax=Corynebacterium pseudotuberculosis (strain C231) TaxID=681645 RepID=D9Q9V0_CORP2|nr:F0F1 ATP synthase subunit B [Corynebacterium pseudotuberculosis]AER68908.1 ATP synthase subunit B [Corynebacterium pseudotuberculosis 1/06-A]ADK28639.1 F0F1 ATP synthase subunit B [Corynebacterium pseudotuberculosis FRC41]ADL10326.1 F0F1 ATP synthase subunit B [Corynebacterium pseudotuberculosis C231]ADL20731.1 F0F1 ATP synthase subunit B [Corynebacterium pseudotuberculosis 1002]ADO26118.1 F0F1 ATP synthase subunit B [Corynebacterium pseudotuberculosis I19]